VYVSRGGACAHVSLRLFAVHFLAAPHLSLSLSLHSQVHKALLVHENIRFVLRCGEVTALVDDEKPMLI
jgi:hypothetical protein